MDLYQQIILDHYKAPYGAGLREPYDAQAYHVNPTCGDEVTLRVAVDGTGGDAVVKDVSYAAQGCSISVASTSVLAEEVTGHTVDEAMDTYAAMKAMLTSQGQGPRRRGATRRRGRVRRRREVPRPSQVRPAGLGRLH